MIQVPSYVFWIPASGVPQVRKDGRPKDMYVCMYIYMTIYIYMHILNYSFSTDDV